MRGWHRAVADSTPLPARCRLPPGRPSLGTKRRDGSAANATVAAAEFTGDASRAYKATVLAISPRREWRACPQPMPLLLSLPHPLQPPHRFCSLPHCRFRPDCRCRPPCRCRYPPTAAAPPAADAPPSAAAPRAAAALKTAVTYGPRTPWERVGLRAGRHAPSFWPNWRRGQPPGECEMCSQSLRTAAEREITSPSLGASLAPAADKAGDVAGRRQRTPSTSRPSGRDLWGGESIGFRVRDLGSRGRSVDGGGGCGASRWVLVGDTHLAPAGRPSTPPPHPQVPPITLPPPPRRNSLRLSG